MNINNLNKIDPKIKELFKSSNTLPFNLHPWRFEKFLDKKVFLELFVKTNPKWQDDSHQYSALGLDYNV